MQGIFRALCVVSLGLVACTGSPVPSSDAINAGIFTGPSTSTDGGSSGSSDGGAPDAGALDAGTSKDGGTTPGIDAGTPPADAGTPSQPDAGSPPDAGTPYAGPVIGGCPILPMNSIWNTDISSSPLSARSAQYVAAIGNSTGLHPDFGSQPWQGAPNGISILVVPASEPMVTIDFNFYPSQSDPGPYPIPLDAPIEGGNASSGDRHVIVLQTGSCIAYELYAAYPNSNAWTAGSGAIWHLDRNEQRPDGWTSADAAGLPILPGLVRYDEIAAGEIRHAIRFTANSVQHAYVYPAVHSDGIAGSDPTHPPMGTRFRLKAGYDISGFDPVVQILLRAMKKYGLVLADTGADWDLGGAPDSRWNDNVIVPQLAQVKGSDFEAVDTGAVHPY